ncbi:hypothetical protein C8R47DRAFT_572421 [Mycena vitilis]|nr:hypothetical protein C8R47DRAFT_572421 [Mycena vitilis]
MSTLCEHCCQKNGDDPSFPPALSLETENVVNRGILTPQTQVSELDAQRHILDVNLGQIVYPVLSLPPEIVSNIFVECLPHHGRVRPSSVAPPLLLVQVCGVWRDIALQTHQLWRSVDVAFSIPPCGDQTAAIHIINRWFSRAKGQPLSLTIRALRAKIPTPIIPLISSVAARIHTLELALSNEDLDILEKHAIVYPNLKRLATSVSRRRDDSFSVLQRAPLVTNLEITGVPAPLSLLPPLLTTLHIRQRIAFTLLLELFQLCPHLLDVTVHVSSPEHSGHRSTTTVPHLRSLAIDGGCLGFLTLPSLRHLNTTTNSCLLAFIQRSRCVLEHLTTVFDYTYSKDRDSRLLKCLRAVPSLTALTIDLDSYMESFAEMFKENPSLLPQLSTLRLSDEQSNFDYPAFTQLLYERRASFPGRTRLLSAQLNLKSSVRSSGDKVWLPPSVAVEFDKLVAQGLKVRATCVDYFSGCRVWPKGSSDLCESFP